MLGGPHLGGDCCRNGHHRMLTWKYVRAGIMLVGQHAWMLIRAERKKTAERNCPFLMILMIRHEPDGQKRIGSYSITYS